MADLIDLGTLKASLGLPADDTAQDAWLNLLISQASAAVVSFIGHPLEFGEYTEFFRLSLGQNADSFILPVTPLHAITAVKWNSTLLKWETGKWSFVKESGIVYPGQWYAFAWGDWEFSYQGGYDLSGKEQDVPALPADIAGATLIAAQGFYYARQRDPALRSETEQGIGTTTWQATDASAASGLPPDAAALLKRYRGGGIA